MQCGPVFLRCPGSIKYAPPTPTSCSFFFFFFSKQLGSTATLSSKNGGNTPHGQILFSGRRDHRQAVCNLWKDCILNVPWNINSLVLGIYSPQNHAVTDSFPFQVFKSLFNLYSSESMVSIILFYLQLPTTLNGLFCLWYRRHGFDPWVGKIPWRWEWLPTSVLLPGETHGQRSLGGCSPWGRKESDTTKLLT